jgi:GH24 family phage-related lysozyme (muramidase)
MESLQEILKRHEGVVYHQYVDTTGNVTVGVGFLIPNQAAVSHFSWEDPTKALADFTALTVLAKDKSFWGKTPGFYKKFTTTTIKDIDGPLLRHCRSIERELTKFAGLGLANLPEQAHNVVVDMAYQVGVSGLVLSFPAFVRAIKAKNWATAAAESGVKQAGMARRVWRSETLLQLAHSSATAAPAEHVICPTCGR